MIDENLPIATCINKNEIEIIISDENCQIAIPFENEHSAEIIAGNNGIYRYCYVIPIIMISVILIISCTI